MTLLSSGGPPTIISSEGGRFDFDDGGTYCGGWQEGKAHGHGVCTGPGGQGTYAGTWHQGFEDTGVYEWPAASGGSYEGQWSGGKRHGLGSETRGCWVYRGEWTEGLKGRYGCRQSIASGAKYDGTWANGLQDGYGSETYADGGTFQGQWAKGMRHGYGVRSSAPFGLAAHRRPSVRKPAPGGDESPSLQRTRPDDCRGGFVLKDYSATGTFGRSLPDKTVKNAYPDSSDEGGGGDSDDAATEDSFVVQDSESIDVNVIETYMGEWKNDKRSGFGIAERSDGIKYEGEWFNNKKFGYGLTTYKSGLEEYGKYKNNVLLQSGGKKHLFILRSGKFKERVQQAVSAAHRASQIALQKADIAISRTATARGKAEQADVVAKQARAEAEIAKMVARQFAPEFQLAGADGLRRGKFNSSQDLSDYPPHLLGDHFNADQQQPPASNAFLDVFRNNPEHRFLRRPSAANLRRPSTIVELKLVPNQLFIPGGGNQYQYQYQQQHQHQQHQSFRISAQQISVDHFYQYYELPLSSGPEHRHPGGRPRPAIDLTELCKLYGIPLSGPQQSSGMEDEEGSAPYLPQRRSTMPTVLDQADGEGLYGDGFVRTGSLYTRKAESVVPKPVGNARKQSLPDISCIQEPPLSRETIALLSSQRREAIRRQEEEAERLRANPLLYLLSPEVWDWLSSQQLVILVLVINIALGFLFFKVIL